MPTSHQVASSKVGVFDHAAVLLQNGHVLRMGGYPEVDLSFGVPPDLGPDPVRNVEEYDPIADLWLWAPEMMMPRALFTATVLTIGPYRGAILVAGGFTLPAFVCDPLYSLSSEFYIPGPDVADGTWMHLPNMAFPRAGHTATVLPSGGVLVVGGILTAYLSDPFDVIPAYTSAEIFDPLDLMWRPTVGSMSEPRYGHTATLLPDGRVLVAGGRSELAGTPELPLQTAEIYDPQTQSFYPASPMSTPRFWASAALLDDGQVLMVGGFVDEIDSHSTSTTEFYRWWEDRWLPGPPLVNVDAGPSSNNVVDGPSRLVEMPDGSLLYFHRNYRAPGKIDRLRDGVWFVEAELVAPRGGGFTATLMPGGQVLIAGGEIGQLTMVTNTNEAYL